MTGAIMEEWLEWFDRPMADCKVLLLLNNFLPHEGALQGFQLLNVCVVFLPSNATSRCQPCDQGIIESLKGHYRQNFTRWCLKKWEDGKDLMQEVNPLMAIRWLVSAWQLDMPVEIMYNCFLKSLVIKNHEEEQEDDEVGLGF